MTKKEQFIRKFKNLLEEFEVEIQIEVETSGYQESYTIEIDNYSRKSPWVKEDSFCIDMGNYINSDCIIHNEKKI